MPTVSLSVPTDTSHAFVMDWKELRLAEGLSPNFDLIDKVEIANFDGATIVQWVVELQPAILPVVSAALTYLVTARGEIEVERNGEKLRFKNIKPSRIKEIMKILDDRSKE